MEAAEQRSESGFAVISRGPVPSGPSRAFPFPEAVRLACKNVRKAPRTISGTQETFVAVHFFLLSQADEARGILRFLQFLEKVLGEGPT